ncbi:MAG: hypothetical protein U0133_14710 [Gemmatimonadales bacterium]
MIPRAVAVIALLALAGGGAVPHPADLPAWRVAPAAEDSLKALWARSMATRREAVACLGGIIGPDTVHVTSALPLAEAPADSLTADAQLSLSDCGPPRWIGTAHTHVRSTDGEEPAPRFSPSDRTVMSLWSTRWGRQGAFCVLYSEKRAHCEVYPPGSNPR